MTNNFPDKELDKMIELLKQTQEQLEIVRKKLEKREKADYEKQNKIHMGEHENG